MTSWTHKGTQWYWQWKQVCEMKRHLSELYNNVYLHVNLVLPYGEKCFWLEQSDVMPSAGWPSMHDWLEDSSNYSASVLQTSIAKNMSSITTGGIKSQMLCVSQQSCLLGYGDYYITLFSYYSTLYRLEVTSWCCNNLSYIFIHTYFHCQAFKVKQMLLTNSGNQLSILPSTKTLLYDAFACAFALQCSFLWLLSKITHSVACKTNRMSQWSPPINWNNDACLVSQFFQPWCSVETKNIFSVW